LSDSIEVVSSPDTESITDEVEGFFKRKIKEVATFMLRTLATCLFGMALAVSTPAVIAAATDPIPVVPPVVDGVQEETTFLDNAKNFGSNVLNGTKSNAVKLYDNFTNSGDERVALLKKELDAAREHAARLESQLVEQNLTTGVKHKRLAICSQEVADYLEDLLEQQSGE